MTAYSGGNYLNLSNRPTLQNINVEGLKTHVNYNINPYPNNKINNILNAYIDYMPTYQVTDINGTFQTYYNVPNQEWFKTIDHINNSLL